MGPGGGKGSQIDQSGQPVWDATYGDNDGSRAIRILNPCTDSSSPNDLTTSPDCQWFDDSTLLSMQKKRWYSAAEADGDGNVVIIGGFVGGGYINRNYPNTNPADNKGAEYTYEYFPPRSDPPKIFQFLIDTSGLNAYAHTFLMPSGKMFVQSNLSSS